MALPWRRAEEDDVESASEESGSSAGSDDEQRTNMRNSGLPGSPRLTYLKTPIVVERKMDETTGLLPIHRQARTNHSVRAC